MPKNATSLCHLSHFARRQPPLLLTDCRELMVSSAIGHVHIALPCLCLCMSDCTAPNHTSSNHAGGQGGAQTSQTKGTQRVKCASDETAAFIQTVATLTPQLPLLTSLQQLPVFATARPRPELLPNFPPGMPVGTPPFRAAEYFSDWNFLGWICGIFRLEISATQLLFTVNNNRKTGMSSAVL